MTSLLGRSLAAMAAGAPGMVDIETFALLVGISKSQAEKCANATTRGTYPPLRLKKQEIADTSLLTKSDAGSTTLRTHDPAAPPHTH